MIEDLTYRHKLTTPEFASAVNLVLVIQYLIPDTYYKSVDGSLSQYKSITNILFSKPGILIDLKIDHSFNS